MFNFFYFNDYHIKKNVPTSRDSLRDCCDRNNYKELFFDSPKLACAAANLATGTLGPEHET